MRLKKNVLIASVCAIITAGLASTPAEAAAASHQRQPAGTLARNPGTRCLTVHSGGNRHTGIICVSVILASSRHAAEVTFSPNSGRLRDLSVASLKASLNGKVIEKAGPLRKSWTPPGIGSFALNWWDEPLGMTQASALNACMVWMDGARACTGGRWLISKPVYA